MTLLGEATHNNGLWHPFEAEMARDDRGKWKMRAIRTLPLYWK